MRGGEGAIFSQCREGFRPRRNYLFETHCFETWIVPRVTISSKRTGVVNFKEEIESDWHYKLGQHSGITTGAVNPRFPSAHLRHVQ